MRYVNQAALENNILPWIYVTGSFTFHPALSKFGWLQFLHFCIQLASKPPAWRWLGTVSHPVCNAAEIWAGVTFAYVLLPCLHLCSFKYRSCWKCQSGFAVIAVLVSDVLMTPITFLPPLCVCLHYITRDTRTAVATWISHLVSSHLVKSFCKIKWEEIWKQNLRI